MNDEFKNLENDLYDCVYFVTFCSLLCYGKNCIKMEIQLQNWYWYGVSLNVATIWAHYVTKYYHSVVYFSGVPLGISIDGCKMPNKPSEIWIDGCKLPFNSSF